jgi:hypothetical protein
MHFPEGFLDVPSKVVIIDLGIEQNPVRADDKGSAKCQAGRFIVDAEHPRKFAGRVRAHGVLYLFKHLFVALPREMDELRIGAYGDDLGACFFEGFVLLCQSSEFSGSNEGEVSGIEEEHRPFFCGFLACEGNFAEIALYGVEGFQFEVRDVLSDAKGATLIRHGVSSLAFFN